MTTFSRWQNYEAPPRHVRPLKVSQAVDIYYADIYINPQKASVVIKDIESQWADGNDAIFEQQLPTGSESALIYGYTLIYKGNQKHLAHIRIYSPK